MRSQPAGNSNSETEGRMSAAIAIYIVVVFVMSVVTFFVYGADKQRAINGDRRVSERTLHSLSFLGGWPGALIAQRKFRHKTQKVPFLIVFWLLVVLHLVIVGAAIYSITRIEAKHRTLEYFEANLDKSITPTGAVQRFGKPDRYAGSGLLIYEYGLVDGSKMYLAFRGDSPIFYAHHLRNDGISEDLPLE